MSIVIFLLGIGVGFMIRPFILKVIEKQFQPYAEDNAIYLDIDTPFWEGWFSSFD